MVPERGYSPIRSANAGENMTPFNFPPLSRSFKAEVKKLDGNRCVLCHTYGTVRNRRGELANRLDVHHWARHGEPLSPVYRKPTLESCVTLCKSCHGKVTANPQSPLAKTLEKIMEERRKKLNHPVPHLFIEAKEV
jgi:hypothetical protein